MEPEIKRGSIKTAYILGVVGVVLTLLMAIAVVYYWEYVQALAGYGYLGVFLICILGGATILIPVPMLAIVFALGGVLAPYWVGIAAGLGETVGALTIYMTGHSAGIALFRSDGKLKGSYLRMMRVMERRGSIALFFLSAVINPFFYPAALAAGALRFGVRRYFLICFLGKTFKGLTVAYAGYWGLRSLLRMLGMPV